MERTENGVRWKFYYEKAYDSNSLTGIQLEMDSGRELLKKLTLPPPVVYYS